MRIRLKTCPCPGFSCSCRSCGEVINVTQSEAIALLNAGRAMAVTDELETAAIRQRCETASLTH